jgi:hypothetical protein
MELRTSLHPAVRDQQINKSGLRRHVDAAAPARRRAEEVANRGGPLNLILGPGLFATPAPEHADRAAILGIEHGPNQGGLLLALGACPDRIGVEAGKDFVLEFVVHGSQPRRLENSTKYQSEQLFRKAGQKCKAAWN